MRPLGDKVVIKLTEQEEVSDGGIHLPDSAIKKPIEGNVIAVGPGRMLDNGNRSPMSVKVGDRVLFTKYGGNEVKIEGEDYTILDEDQIYAILHSPGDREQKQLVLQSIQSEWLIAVESGFPENNKADIKSRYNMAYEALYGKLEDTLEFFGIVDDEPSKSKASIPQDENSGAYVHGGV